MNLNDVAENDLSFTLEDEVYGFGVDIKLTDENQVDYNLTGYTTDHGFFIDPGTGVGASGRNAEIGIRLSSLITLGGGTPTKKWKFETPDANGNLHKYSIEETQNDRKIGLFKMIVGVLDAS